jgi:hypothetical protein
LPSAPNSGPQYQTAADASTGAFEFPKVAPGSYVLYSTIGGANGPKARSLLEVRDQDVENISLLATPGFPISIQVRFEGAGTAAELTRLRVSLRPDPAIAGLPAPSAAPSAEGTASISGILAGGYRLYVSPLLNPQGATAPAIPENLQSFYVKSARLGDQDVLVNGLSLETKPEGSLEIVIATSPGSLAGRAASGDAGVRVVLIPDEGRGFRSDAYRHAFTDASGQFAFRGIPPGAYHLYARDDVADGAWLDPDFMRGQDGRGAAILIREGKNPDVEVK